MTMLGIRGVRQKEYAGHKPLRFGRHSNWILKAQNCQTLELCINDVSRSVKRSLAGRWRVWERGKSKRTTQDNGNTSSTLLTGTKLNTVHWDTLTGYTGHGPPPTAHCPLATGYWLRWLLINFLCVCYFYGWHESASPVTFYVCPESFPSPASVWGGFL